MEEGIHREKTKKNVSFFSFQNPVRKVENMSFEYRSVLICCLKKERICSDIKTHILLIYNI